MEQQWWPDVCQWHPEGILSPPLTNDAAFSSRTLRVVSRSITAPSGQWQAGSCNTCHKVCMTLTKTGKVALESWPYNKQRLAWCCVCDCFKDNVHCLTQDYFSNSLLSLGPRTGLHTCFKSPVLQSATFYLEMKHESLGRIHFTQRQLSIFPIWNIYQCYLSDELKVCLDTLFTVAL